MLLRFYLSWSAIKFVDKVVDNATLPTTGASVTSVCNGLPQLLHMTMCEAKVGYGWEMVQ